MLISQLPFLMVPHELPSILGWLSVSKSAGPGGIHPQLLKSLAPFIAGPMASFLTKLWKQAKYPLTGKLL